MNEDVLRAAREVRLLLGVCGSVSAIAVPHLVLWLRSTLQLQQVDILLTTAARGMVGLPIWRAVTNGRVVAGWDDLGEAGGAAHVQLARDADVLVVLPATANFLAKAAQGIADDLLSRRCSPRPAPWSSSR